jgi:hypothetical protein
MDADGEREVMKRASLAGWTLIQRETELGQLVWSWLPAGRQDFGPQFLTRREALEFMRQRQTSPADFA